jgi:glyoxylase-like metal-dependent hydrolase (beta-lactamase superfamily II)
MTQLTRRGMLTGAAAITATALSLDGHAPARAAAPPAGKQVPGFYRYKVGDIEVTAVTDGARTFPLPDNFVKNAPKEAVAAAMSSMYMDATKAMAPFTPVVVNTGSKLIVIDTGLGPAQFEQSKGAIGQFHSNLAAAGIDRNAVDAVIISHFHGDHINGLVTADNKPAFPNAEIMVPAAEWKFWSDDGEMSKATGGLKTNFENARRVFGVHGNKVTPYESGKELVPGVTAMATPGHTPGHTSHVIASGNSKVLVQADVTAAVGLLFVRNPGWHAIFDMDGNLAEQTRRKMYDMAATDKIMIQGFHFPFPALGYVEKDGANYRLVPVAWSPVI